jgi:hypothetical protein
MLDHLNCCQVTVSHKTQSVMCDQQVLSLQNVLQSVPTRVPIVVLQRVEETHPAVREGTVSV